MKVEILKYSELPESVNRNEYKQFGSRLDLINFMVIYDDYGKIINVKTDHLDTDDCSFYRGLSWIGRTIIGAYHMGKSAR